MNLEKVSVSVVGGSGYAGGELIRLLLRHPGVKISQVTSRNFAGRPVTLLHPNLRKATDLVFCHPDDLKPCDLLFLALPNGESMKAFKKWSAAAEKIIDLGADFRFDHVQDWERWYGQTHAAPEYLNEFVYGLPELYRDRIKTAKWVAGPGCEAAVSILCLYPFIKNGLIKNSPIIIDAKMSSSQAGIKFSWSSHHPERAGAVRCYKPTGHRHTGEIERVFKPFDPGLEIHITATAIEMVRGILVSIHAFMKEKYDEAHIRKIIKNDYGEEPFIRLVKTTQGLYRLPEPKIVTGTNFCDIGFEIENYGSRIVIVGAIDNLMKGAAGNAVQCLNLMCGFPETTGLDYLGLHPL